MVTMFHALSGGKRISHISSASIIDLFQIVISAVSIGSYETRWPQKFSNTFPTLLTDCQRFELHQIQDFSNININTRISNTNTNTKYSNTNTNTSSANMNRNIGSSNITQIQYFPIQHHKLIQNLYLMETEN